MFSFNTNHIDFQQKKKTERCFNLHKTVNCIETDTKGINWTIVFDSMLVKMT